MRITYDTHVDGEIVPHEYVAMSCEEADEVWQLLQRSPFAHNVQMWAELSGSAASPRGGGGCIE